MAHTTAARRKEMLRKDASELVLNITGICVSPGAVTGTVHRYKKGVMYKKNDILILDEWLTSGVAALKDVGGLLSSRGGITCHASIIAREYGVPCLVSVKNIDMLSDGTHIEMNATSEKIKIL
ncbi:MAG: PEP-utilizing enzyme [Patescibacteria group bacterium]